MRKIAAFGFCTIDIYEDTGIYYATGNGINCVINLSKHGVEGSAVTVVGTDHYGEEMIRLLKTYSIDTSHVQVVEGETSVFRMALKNGNDRVHLENIPGVMENYIPTTEDINFVKEHEYVHMDLTGHVLHLLPELKEAGCKIIMDYSIKRDMSTLKSTLPYVDYAFFSYGEKDGQEMEFLEQMYNHGADSVVATFGSEGSLCFENGKWFRYGVNKSIPVVNTVGAGDSFIAGFVYGKMQKYPTEECMETGAKFADEVVQNFNPY